MFKVPCTLLVRISVENDGISGQRCIPHRRDPSGDGPTIHRPYLLCNSPFPFSCSARNSYISLTNACLGLFMFFSMSSAMLQEDSHNNIAPGFALLHFPFFLKIHCYFKSGSGAHGLSPRECMRFARRVSWTEKVLEGHELFNAPKTNCGKLWSKMVKMNHWKVVGRFNDHDFDIF